jgi:hypothetical protein
LAVVHGSIRKGAKADRRKNAKDSVCLTLHCRDFTRVPRLASVLQGVGFIDSYICKRYIKTACVLEH